jgi:hypothetical protein
MNHSYDRDHAHKLVVENNRRLEQGDQPGHSFTWHGVAIHDPFSDPSGRYPVDPVEEYGQAFLESDFCRLPYR